MEVERWFVREGMPALARRHDPVVARMLPFTVVLAAYTPPFLLLGALLLPGIDPADAPLDDGLRVFGCTLAGAVVAAAAAVGVLRLRRRRPWLRSRVAGYGAIGLALLTNSVPWFLVGPGLVPANLADTAVVLVIAYLLVLGGVGALLVAGLRRLVTHATSLLSMVSRAVPLLLLLVAFLFVNAETWQMTANLSRGRLWAVIGFLVAVMVLFLAVRLPRELAAIEVPLDRDRVLAACAGTPLAVAAERYEPAERRPLRRRERLNLVGLLFVGQVVQVVVLAAAVFVVFLVFGHLAITDATIAQWIARPAVPGTLLGVDVPLSEELIQVSLLIAALSGLYFTIYSVTDAGYRAEFLDDLLHELADVLLAREVHLSTTPRP